MEKLELEQFELKDRNLYIYNDIDSITSSDFLKAINDLQVKDNDIIYNNKETIKKLDPNIEFNQHIPDINIFLNTVGGYCYDGFDIHDAIQELNNHCKVNIIVAGKCMSMGIPILLSVPYEQRVCRKNTTFMIHQTSSFAAGKTADLEDEVKEGKRLTEMVYNIIIENTAITRKELDKNYSKKEDWIINAEQALELKLVSKII